jgi:serine/threonine protein kinase
MGVVWQARDERLGRTVAVKQLRAPVGMSSTQIEQSQLRARREARIAARLHHPHAVAVYDVVEHDGRPCIVMEYVPSSTLSAVLADGNVLPAAEVGRMGSQLASALLAAHEAGIVHRDVKPGNILIAEGGAVKLTDFGISRATGDVTVTATGEMLGTPAYTSPEAAQGRLVGAASDVFSLGATLYAALEGEPPFGTGPTAMALLLRIVNGEVRPPERTSALTGTVMAMLRHDPGDRPSMDEVRRSLELATAETIAVAPMLFDDHQGPDAEPEDGGVAVAEGDESVEGGGSAEGGNGAEDGENGAVGEREPADAAAALVPAPASDWSPAGPANRRPWTRRRMLPWILLAVAALLIGGIVAALTASNGSGGSPAATKTSSSAQASRSAASSASAGGKTSAPPSSSPSRTSASTTSPASSSASSTSTTTTAQQLTSAIENYYQLVPGHLDQAWGYMTANYQQNTAKGMSGYQSFWSKIDRVSLSDLVAQPPSTVTVTIDYFYKNGQTVQERTEFGLVRQDGILKIATSSVLSSRTS